MYKTVCNFILAGLLTLFAVATLATPVTLHTLQGKLLGETSGLNDAIKVFKGIPFATPPVGNRRWKHAEPPANWTGTRDATQFGPVCMQMPYPDSSAFGRALLPSSEDCLYLNIWTPAGAQALSQNASNKLPVMVWFHGGAHIRGSGATDTYDGTALAQKGVIVVTINYRLGVFGYFALPELIEESPHNAASNYGTSDQIQALRWVQHNISAFGGDPNNVTIFGESAGSHSVNHMMASPLAAGLYHRGIGASGTSLDPMTDLTKTIKGAPAPGGLSAVAIGEKFSKDLGGLTLTELRDMTATDLLVAATEYGISTSAVVDGWIIPEQIYDIFTQGKQNPVPVLLGFNADEGTVLSAARRVPKTADAYAEQIRADYGALAQDYLRQYPANDNYQKSFFAGFRDTFAGWGTVLWTRSMAKVNQPAYLYFFSHRPPGPNQQQFGAYHGAEIAYVFDNIKVPVKAEQHMAEIMSNYWVAFAKTGVPKVEGQPEWQTYRASNPDYMEFNSESGSGAMPKTNLLPGMFELQSRLKTQIRE